MHGYVRRRSLSTTCSDCPKRSPHGFDRQRLQRRLARPGCDWTCSRPDVGSGVSRAATYLSKNESQRRLYLSLPCLKPLKGIRPGEGVDLIRKAVRMVMQELRSKPRPPIGSAPVTS